MKRKNMTKKRTLMRARRRPPQRKEREFKGRVTNLCNHWLKWVDDKVKGYLTGVVAVIVIVSATLTLVAGIVDSTRKIFPSTQSTQEELIEPYKEEIMYWRSQWEKTNDINFELNKQNSELMKMIEELNKENNELEQMLREEVMARIEEKDDICE